MRRLEDIIAQTCEMFDASTTWFANTAVDNGDMHKIGRFYIDLQNSASKVKETLQGLQEPALNHSIYIATIASTLSERPFISALSVSCSLCAESDWVYYALEQMKRNEDFCSELMVRYECLRHLPYDDSKCHQGAHSETRSNQERRILELVEIFEMKSATILQELGLLASMPTFIRDHPLYLLDPLFLSTDQHVSKLVDWTDCLGRTPLMKFLDSTYRPNLRSKSSLETYVEPRITENTINNQDVLGRTALHIACQKEERTVVNFLLKKGASVRLKTMVGSTPLHYATTAGNFEVCELLLSRSELDANVLDDQLRGPLFYAVKSRHLRTTKALLRNQRVDPNASGGKSTHPLSAALYNNDYALAKCLLRRGADPSLHWDYLLGRCAFHKNINMLQMLIDCRPGYVQPFLGHTRKPFIFRIIRYMWIGAFDYILTLHNFDVNATSRASGDTALIYSVKRRNIYAIKRLLKHPEIDLTVRNANGHTALSLAENVGHDNIVELLKNAMDIRSKIPISNLLRTEAQ